jgi:hypothetical protein
LTNAQFDIRVRNDLSAERCRIWQPSQAKLGQRDPVQVSLHGSPQSLCTVPLSSQLMDSSELSCTRQTHPFLNGKEGVDGSSPSEGFAKAPHVGLSRSGRLARRRSCSGYGAVYGALPHATRPLRRERGVRICAEPTGGASEPLLRLQLWQETSCEGEVVKRPSRIAPPNAAAFSPERIRPGMAAQSAKHPGRRKAQQAPPRGRPLGDTTSLDAERSPERGRAFSN